MVSAFVAVASGCAPIAVILAIGALVGSLADVGARTTWALIALIGALIVQAGLRCAEQIASQELTARYLATVYDVLAAASLGPRHIGHLEDPTTARHLGAVSEALREGNFLYGVTSTSMLVAARLSSVGSAVVLATFRWWAPIVLLAGWFVVGWSFDKWLSTVFDELVSVTGSERRRAEYVRGLLMGGPAAKEVRIFGLSRHLVEVFGATWLKAMSSVWRHRLQSFWPLGIAAVALLSSNAAVFGSLGLAAYGGAISLGAIAVYVQAVHGVQNTAVLGEPQTQLGRAAALALHLRRLAEATREENPLPSKAKVPARVELREVTFGYPHRATPVLRGLSLSIPAGQSIAIVGENGAGKSTLIKLLCGLYGPDAGEVDVGGARVAAIFQDFVRYHLTLRENVAFGNPDGPRDDAALSRAIADAGATALLDQRLLMDTVLSAAYEGGTDLSGGQWQRVALARALMALDGGAGVLVLDEPTASLDVRAEAELFDRFLSVTRGTTTILVSHRLSSVRHADRIVVLADGVIVEDGTHDDLMALGGRYATMFSLQARRFLDA
ncbi:ABC transporter ATP-binding protein [Tenggerimyces flavus]|uniref:ABC transporter ATP-binding protein n=1 Tax=Tenggerimyces flavus TaxID=1708749 RepID=A0ABV7YFQ0_9ACTN|nr:ABC transporter ATP-binding protein [Tenggerimyces flavus]MBM7786084.1 ATP-binding cassette subfamily B protein [Tenggerimyces flavus]